MLLPFAPFTDPQRLLVLPHSLHGDFIHTSHAFTRRPHHFLKVFPPTPEFSHAFLYEERKQVLVHTRIYLYAQRPETFIARCHMM
eukprot:1161392-Pelagomonas_calceolata.AAC.12